MGRKRVNVRLFDILDAIAAIGRHLKTEPLETFETNELVYRAVERELEILSEASRHIPDEMKVKHPGIPWRQVADIGNVLRHVYDTVDPELIRSVIRKDIPELENTIRKMLTEAED